MMEFTGRSVSTTRAIVGILGSTHFSVGNKGLLPSLQKKREAAVDYKVGISLFQCDNINNLRITIPLLEINETVPSKVTPYRLANKNERFLWRTERRGC